MQNSTEDGGKPSILLACTDISFGATLANFLSVDGFEIHRCHDMQGVLRITSRRDFDVLVLDLDLDVEGDMDLLSFVLQKNPSTRVILLFDISMIDRALDGIRQGAFFYLPKSCTPSDTALVVSKAVRSHSTQASIDDYELALFEDFAGHTQAMQRVIELIRKVSPTDSTVLLLGESGTGKEVVANTVHRLSHRRGMPFIAINCAALPEGLLESEMFGHVKGAFTGAEKEKRGLFEEANGGTILLDEIGDMSLVTQAKLLRVLQNGEIRRVGSSVPQRVDVRVIAATNHDLVEAVAANQFREDLYFRLNVIQIRIPALRERMDALPSLVHHFLHRSNSQYGKNVRGFDEHSASLLRHYEFPGNVRELESIVAHAVIMADGAWVRAKDLPEQVQHGLQPRLALPYDAERGLKTLAQVEEQHIRGSLDTLEGNQTLAAKRLGISRSTLWRKMREYGIDKNAPIRQ